MGSVRLDGVGDTMQGLGRGQAAQAPDRPSGLQETQMIIFPAVDMRRGRCVRLVQGRAEQETVYSEDPLVVARQWCDQGASWLHLVDLDGAMVQDSHNRAIAREIFRALPIPVQFGGGVRTLSDIGELLSAGAARVILGTVAVERPDLVEEALSRHPGQVIVGLDARRGRVATRGWNQLESLEALPFARDLARRGVDRIVYTDIGKDGTLQGPNLEAIGQMARESGLKVIASGGVSSLQDLSRLNSLKSSGVEGVIVGKALYEGRFSLEAALSAVRG